MGPFVRMTGLRHHRRDKGLRWMLGGRPFSHWRGGHSQCMGGDGNAPVVKLVNTLDLKSNGDYSLPVQVRLGAPLLLPRPVRHPH